MYTNEAPDGTVTTRTHTDAGETTIARPDGTTVFTDETPDPRFGMSAPVIGERRVRLPSGTERMVTAERSVALADESDPLSLTSLVDTITTNSREATAAYDAASRQWTYTSPEGRVVTETQDAVSRPVRREVTGLAAVQRNYDTRGRLASVVQGSGSDERPQVHQLGRDFPG